MVADWVVVRGRKSQKESLSLHDAKDIARFQRLERQLTLTFPYIPDFLGSLPRSGAINKQTDQCCTKKTDR